MEDYEYIEALFRVILEKSLAIQGRFSVATRYGMQEINYDDVGKQIIDYAERNNQKYPLAMMTTPISYVHISGRNEGWEVYRVMIFFVDITARPDNINPRTRTTTKSVPQTQSEMKRVAMDFLKQLQKQSRKPPVRFEVSDNQMFIMPVSKVGMDGVSGVKIDFDLKVQIQCLVEDYAEDVVITLPS